MTGHILSDLVLLCVGAIVTTWVTSALFGWMYLAAWLLLPTTVIGRRLSGLFRRNS